MIEVAEGRNDARCQAGRGLFSGLSCLEEQSSEKVGFVAQIRWRQGVPFLWADLFCALREGGP